VSKRLTELAGIGTTAKLTWGQYTICPKLHASRVGSSVPPLAAVSRRVGRGISYDVSPERRRDAKAPCFLLC